MLLSAPVQGSGLERRRGARGRGGGVVVVGVGGWVSGGSSFIYSLGGSVPLPHSGFCEEEGAD